jgi:hypothetical protein
MKTPVRSEVGTILEVSPLNLYLIVRLKFKGNQFLLQREKNLVVENRFNDK